MVFDDTPCLNNMTMQLRNNNSFTILGINHIHMHLPAFSLRLSSGCSPYSNIMFYFQGFLCLPCNTRGKDDRKRCVEVMERGIGYGQHQWCMIVPPLQHCVRTNIKQGWETMDILGSTENVKWDLTKVENYKSQIKYGSLSSLYFTVIEREFNFFPFCIWCRAKGPGSINLFLFYQFELFYPVGQSCPPWPTWHPWGSFQIRAVFSLRIESNLLNSPHRLHGFQRPKYFQKFIYDWHPVLRLIILLVSRMT